MTDPAERFIEAAIRPFGDNAELEIAARHELAQLMAVAGNLAGDPLETVTERLEETDRRPRRKWWRIGLYTVTGIVSAVVLAMSGQSLLIREVAALAGMLGHTITPMGFSPDAKEGRMSRHLTPEQRLLLLGDTRRSGKAERIKGLWESKPRNPAYFADYTAAHLSEHSSLPPDFLETARELDPGNAWFPAIAAATAAHAALDQSRHGTATSPGGVRLKAIRDSAKLDEALALLHEAAPMKRFDNYQLTLLKQRIPLLPKRTDNLDQTVSLAYVAGLTAPNMRFRSLADAVKAKAIQLAEDKDAAGFKRLLADWEAFTTTYARWDYGILVDVMIARVTIQGPLKTFHQAATDLGLAEDAARLKALDERFEAWRTATRTRTDPNEDLALRSGLLPGLSMPTVSKQLSRPLVIQPEELEPGRLADHALAGRIMSLIGWLSLGMAMLAAGCYRFRGSRLTRGLSARLVDLLRPVDWMWILGIGLVLPLLYYHAIHRFTPLGGREWSLKVAAFIPQTGPFLSMLLLMIALPVAVARKRLGLRAGAAGLADGKNLVAWSAALCAALALPLFGAVFVTEADANPLLIAAACLLGILQLYCLAIGIRALFSRHAGLLRRVTLSRILMPTYATGMLLMIVAVPLYHAEEKHWIAWDRLTEISADAPGLTRFEYEVTQLMKEELLEILGLEP